jgi:hypothetical protein
LAVFPYNSTTATGSSGAYTITVASNTGIAIGQQVTGTGIGTNCVVRSINSTTITLTVANSGAVSGTIIFQGDYLYLLNKDVNFIREAYPVPTSTGLPKYYALFGSQYSNPNELSFILGPTPDSSYNTELHYFYYPVSIVQGAISGIGTITGGSLYTNGSYSNVPLTGGSGAGVTANITVSGQAVTAVTIKNSGNFYVAGDTLSCSNTYIGGSGSGLSIPVSAVNNTAGTSWLGDNYDPVLLYGAMREAMLFMKGEQDLVKYYEDKYTEALSQLNRLGSGLERGDAYRDGQYRMGQVKP